MGMLAILWPVFTALAIFAVLGWTLAVLIGLRGLWAVAAAPAFATTVIGIAATIAGWLNLRWSILPALVLAVIIAAVIVVVRRTTGSREIVRFPRRLRWWTVGVLAVTAVTIGWLAFRVIGGADAISQSFDNIFHLNGIRYILDTGIASPLEIGQMTSPGGGVPFYPTAWHATAAIVVQLSGASIPVVINTMSITTAAIIWPLGALLLARTLLGSSPSVMIGAGIVAASVPAFPLLPMDYGVLYPYQLSLALLPLALAATASLLGIGRHARRIAPGWWGLIVVGAVPGLALAHPGGFVAWLALSVPMVVVFGVRLWRAAHTLRNRVLVLVGAIAFVGAGVLLLKVLRPPLASRLWATEAGVGEAIGQALSVQLFYPTAAWLVGLAIIAGLFWMIRERSAETIVAAAMWAVGAGLFVVSLSFTWGALRDALTGSWYNNWPRLAALFAVALVPLAALGIARTADAVSELLRRRRVAGGIRLTAGIAVSVLALLAFHAQATPRAEAWAGATYVEDADALLLTDDETALLERLDEVVPEDAVIAGSAYTGAGLAYALADRQVLMPHALMDISPELELINDHLADADMMPEVCDAIDALGVEYVLDFGTVEVHEDEVHPLPGVQDLQDSSAVRLVDSEGDARLYEVIACDRN